MDIDDAPGDQRCTPADAEDICDSQVRTVIRDALDEVLGGGNEVPVKSSSVTFNVSSPELCDFVPDIGDPGGGGSGSGGGSTNGVDESGSTGSEAVGPWGDLSTLVSCNSSNVCDVDRELIRNVTDNFGIFYAEGVTMNLVTSPFEGAQLDGLGKHEDSTDLTDAFGLHSGEVVVEVQGIDLDSEENAAKILSLLSDDPSPVTFVAKQMFLGTTVTRTFTLRFSG